MLRGVDNVTVYTFMYNILTPDSAIKSRNVWCSADRSKAWEDWMLNGKEAPPAPANCTAPNEKILALGQKMKVTGTPTIFFTDGTRIPGHWEGDLIMGKENGSAIGTVVERASGYLMLLHLAEGRNAEHVAAALTRRLQELPEQLRQSLTWDQGKEMSKHAQVRVDAGIDIYFADPRTPWHRPSNENTNGLLRQYFPKGTDLSVHSAEHLLFVEREMNDRPRKRLDYAKPQELMTQLLLGV